MFGSAPMCLSCKHFNEDSEDPITCEAFKDGIPDEIFDEGHEHTRPYPGDGGIMYERR